MKTHLTLFLLLVGACSLLAVSMPADARGGARTSVNGGGGGGGNRSNANANRSANQGNRTANNTNANRNVNRNTSTSRSRDVNVDREVDIDVDGNNGCCNDWDDRDYHPVAAGMAVAGTAAIIGSMVNTVPSNCVPIAVNGMTYQQCGSTWYQPQMNGSSTTYVVVNSPQ